MYLRSEAEKGSYKSPAKRVLWEEEKQRHREHLMLCIKCVNCGFDFDDMGQQLSWLEHTTDNREVDGSSPFWPTTSKQRKIPDGGLAQLGERLPCKQEVTGSIPVLSTKELTEVSRNWSFIEFLGEEIQSAP